jgi:hypothetical protein
MSAEVFVDRRQLLNALHSGPLNEFSQRWQDIDEYLRFMGTSPLKAQEIADAYDTCEAKGFEPEKSGRLDAISDRISRFVKRV